MKSLDNAILDLWLSHQGIFNNIPRAQMGSELIAHEAEGRMGYLLRAHSGLRNNTVLVKSN